MIGSIRGGPAMRALFSEALPRLLEESRLKYADFSLFVALEGLTIMEEGILSRDENLLTFQSGDSTIMASAVCVDHTDTGPLMAIYRDVHNIPNQELMEKCSILLKTSPDNLKLHSLGEGVLQFTANLPESQVTSTETLCFLAEMLLSCLDYRKVSAIQSIRFPIASAGTLHFHLTVDGDKANLKMYNLFGSESGKMENIFLGAQMVTYDLEHICSDGKVATLSSKKLILSCLQEMGFDVTQLTDEESFVSFGLDSLELAELEQRLSSKTFLPLPVNCVEQNPSVATLSLFLNSLKKAKSNNEAVILGSVPSKWQRRILIAGALEPLLTAQFNETVGFRIADLILKEKERTTRQLNQMMQKLIVWNKSLSSTYTYEAKQRLSGTECYVHHGNEAMEIFVSRSIDVSNGPPFLWNIHHDVICILLHHVAVDGHSIRLLVRQLLNLYQGKEPAPVIQCLTDNLDNEVEELAEKEMEESIPTDFPPPSEPKRRAIVYRKELPKFFSEVLRKLRSRLKVTDFEIFCSAFSLANQKRTGNEGVEIGMAVSVRKKEQEHLVDCLVTVVPVRLNAKGTDSLEEHIRNTAKAVKHGREKAEKTKARKVQVLLVTEKVEKITYSGIEQVNVPTAVCKHDQVWYFRKTASKWEIVVEFCGELFHENTIAASVDAVLRTIRRMALSCESSTVNQISLGSFEDFQKCDFPKTTIGEIFRERRYGRAFWKFGEECVSQREMERKALETARSWQQQYLCHYGEVSSGDRQLVLFVPRSINLGIYVSASWKLGLAVVPISRDWENGRIVDTVRRFHNAMVTTDNQELKQRLKEGHACVAGEGTKNGQIRRIWNSMSTVSLGYMTCTSGSTGQPKVVCSSIQGLSNLGANYARSFSISQRSVVYQVVNYAFDIFFADITKAIVSGSSIVFAKEALPSLQEIMQCSCAYVMPAVLSSLPPDHIQNLGCLETLHFGGESIRASALQRLLKIKTSLFQEFGLTEHSVYSSFSRQKVFSDVKGLGRPYPNQGFLLRDRDGNTLGGSGSRGELFVKGMVARGYHGMREINQQRFRGGEMATRDMVCLQEQQLGLGGRMDLQVKILGRRVELGEVEAVLSKHPEVEMAVVTVQNDKLYAHITAKKKINGDQLMAICQKELQFHMVPEEIFFLDRIPLNANGKVDRKQLLVRHPNQLEKERREPQTDMEDLLCKVMANVLGREVSVDECFFRAGGNSLKAMFVVQELKEHGWNVVVRDVFDLKTPEKIARRLELKCLEESMAKNNTLNETAIISKESTNDGKEALSLVSSQSDVSLESPCPLSHIQRRLWFVQKLHPESDAYKCTLRIRFTTEVDEWLLRKAIEKMQKLNTFLRCQVVEREGTPLWEFKSSESSDLLKIDWKQGECLLHLNHLICDGRSLAILAEQLALLYSGLAIPIQPFLPPSEDKTDFSFWSKYLENVTVPMFPERPKYKAKFPNEVGSITIAFPLKTETRLKDNRETVFSFLVAAVVEVMRKVFDEEDIVIGTTVANRTKENSNTVGLFANTLPMRFRERKREEEREAADQIHSILDHQNSSLEQIQRTIGISDLLACVVNYQNVSIDSLPLTEEITLETELLNSKHAQFPLSWIFSHQSKGMRLTLEFDTGVIAKEDAQKWTSMYFREMGRILAYRPLPPQMGQLSVVDYPKPHLGWIIAKQSNRSFSGSMLRTNQKDVSYGEGWSICVSLARAMEKGLLRTLGRPPRPDDIVVIQLDEGLHLHLVINAVLFMGCAYTVVSPKFPDERQLLMIEETKPTLVISSFPCIKHCSKPFYLRASHENLVYLMFTSGSTGRPKGVPIGGTGICNMLSHATQLYSLRPRVRVLQFTKSHFDASISNTFGPFVNGGTLCLRSEEEEAAEEVRTHLPLALLHMTPAVLDYLYHENELISGIESWSIGGESPSTSTVLHILNKGSRLVQLYGPTEATCYQTSSVLNCWNGVNNVGPAIPNVLVGVCDWNNGRIGGEDVGQFFCGGIQLARGYLNDKQKTDKTFVANPLLSEEDQILRRNMKIYLTGDRVRIEENKRLHFLGRRDQQVKVNGHRIELGEVENAISSLPTVQSTAVVSQRDQTGKLHLVAFVTGDDLEEGRLLQSIRRKLPAHMIPMRVISLDKMPTTANAKIDKRALAERMDLIATVASNSKETEESEGIAIYKQLLGDMENDDNFFFKGGHSLLANKLAYKLQNAFGVDVPVAKVFEFPTSKQMMKWIRKKQSLKTTLPFPNTQVHSDLPSPLQLPLLRIYRNPLMQQVYNNHTEIVFHVDISRHTVITLINSLLLAHPSLRTTFHRVGKIIKKTILSGTECHLKPSNQTYIDVFKGIPVSMSHEGTRIVLNTNHAVVDGHSMAILVENLQTLLKGGQLKRDTAENFHSWLEAMFNQSRAKSLKFWTTQLEGFSFNPLLDSNNITNFSSRNVILKIGNLPLILSSLAKKFSSTPFSVLLAATLLSLFNCSSRPCSPVAVGFPVNLRPAQFNDSAAMGVTTSFVTLRPWGKPEKDIPATTASITSAISNPLPFDELLRLVPGGKVFDVMLTFDDYTLVSNKFFHLENTKEEFTKSPIAIFAGPNSEELVVDYMEEHLKEEMVHKIMEKIRTTVLQWNQNEQEKKQQSSYYFKTSHPLSPSQTQMLISSESGVPRVLPFILELPGKVDKRRITQLLNLLLQKHECLRTVFFLGDNGEPRQTVKSLTETFHLPVFQKYEKGNPPRSILVEQNVVELQIDGRLAVLWLHHIVSDAWSTRIIENEIIKLMTNKIREVSRNKSSLVDIIRSGKLLVKTPSSVRLDKVLCGHDIFHSQIANATVFKEHFDVILENNVFASVVLAVVQSVLATVPSNSLNIGFPFANRNGKNSHIVGYFLNNLVINVSNDDSLKQIEEKKAAAMAENATFSEFLAEVRKIRRRNEDLFQIYVNCRYDLEKVTEVEEELMDMLPLSSEFPLEVDVDCSNKNYKLTIRGRSEYFSRNRFSEIFLQVRKKLERGNKTLDTVISAAKIILNRDITATESFFGKGGTSLQAISLAEELEEQLGIEVDMELIYTSKSIGEIAERLGGNQERENTFQIIKTPTEKGWNVEASFSSKQDQRKTEEKVFGGNADVPKACLSRILTLSASSSPSRTLFLLPDHSKVTFGTFLSSVASTSQHILTSFLRLTGRPLRPDDVIPVVCQKSIETWALCLAVIHSGAAYMPLDLANPIERLKSAFKLSSAACYLGEQVNEACLTRIILNKRRKISATYYSRNQDIDVSYVISTSGTTGQPKAVCAVHRGVLNMVMASIQDMRLTPRDVLFQFTNFCFDNSVLELFSSLAASSTVIIDSSPFSPRRFSRLVYSHNISHCLLFPALVSLFKDDTFSCLSTLRYWVVGAEKLPKKLMDKALREGVSVIQNYGPTETTAYALTRHMRMGDEATNLGRPIQNCLTRMFGDELALGGRCLMRGYLGRRDAFRLQDDILWYLTGDEVRRTEEGNTLFVGRKDSQVKIRGHRVELGEVEERVLVHPGIQQCRARWKEPNLTVYCVAPSLQEKEIIDHCEEALPFYMRPNEIVVLEELPVTTNAKTDFRSLEGPNCLQEIVAEILKTRVDSSKTLLENAGTTKEGLRIIEKAQKILGWSPTVQQLMSQPLAEITERKEKKSSVREAWEVVLGHAAFNKDCHFLLSGGSSLHLLRLRQELNRKGIDVSLKSLMELPKLGQMERLECPRLCSIVVHPAFPIRTLVFLHPLYGGCAHYIHLQYILDDGETKIIFIEHPNTLAFATEDREFFESIDSLTDIYAQQVQGILDGDVIFLGASIGGTLAVEVARKLKITPKLVILFDTLANPDLENYEFHQHKQQLLSVCSFVDSAVLSNSWDLLQMLRRHPWRPVAFPLELFSVDGSDLGWSRLCPRLSVHRVSGPHSSLLSPSSSAALAASIRRLL